MRNLKYVLVLLLSSVAFAQNKIADCNLNASHDGDTITIRGVAIRQPHDLAFAVDGCNDLVILTYAGDQDSGVTADLLKKNESLRQFHKYTNSTYRSRGTNVCTLCMKYADVKATLTGKLQVAALPEGTTKDSFGFLHDASGKVVGTSGFGHPTRQFKYRLVILSVEDVKAHKLPRPVVPATNATLPANMMSYLQHS
ncbi:MAG TPA: hypothetical protein VKZ53_27855 [Candidatus Angelobacter sp.]|nr:hypothetical protein [Candidatus Angelobacter sp.]